MCSGYLHKHNNSTVVTIPAEVNNCNSLFMSHERTSRNLSNYVCVRNTCTSKAPYVAIDERGLVRNIHLFLFSCVH